MLRQCMKSRIRNLVINFYVVFIIIPPEIAWSKEAPAKIAMSLPNYIGGLSKTGSRAFEDERLGVSLSYKYDGLDATICSTVYIWDMGFSDINTGIESEEIIYALKHAEAGIYYYSEKGRYSNVSTLETDTYRFPNSDDTAQNVLRAKYSYSSKDGNCGGDVLSYTYLLGLRNHFLKIRATAANQTVSVESRIDYFAQSIVNQLSNYELQKPNIRAYALASVFTGKGIEQQTSGNFENALGFYGESLRVEEREFGKNSREVAVTLDRIGRSKKSLGDYAGAIKAFKRSIRIKESLSGPRDPSIIPTINSLAGTYLRTSDFESAKNGYGKILDIMENEYRSESAFTAMMHSMLGTTNKYSNDLAQARIHFEQARDIYENMGIVNSPEFEETMAELELISNKLGVQTRSTGREGR
jgi:tetratricopeptide (TPR) repeat protein